MPDIIITDAGLAAAIDAANNGVTIAIEHVAVGDGRYDPTEAQTALQNEVARVPVAGGQQVTSAQLHLYAVFQTGAWKAYEIGFFMGDGTLFAVSSNGAGGAPIIEKRASENLVQSFDILLSRVPAGSVSVNTGIISLFYAPEFARVVRAITENAQNILENANAIRNLNPGGGVSGAGVPVGTLIFHAGGPLPWASCPAWAAPTAA